MHVINMVLQLALVETFDVTLFTLKSAKEYSLLFLLNRRGTVSVYIQGSVGLHCKLVCCVVITGHTLPKANAFAFLNHRFCCVLFNVNDFLAGFLTDHLLLLYQIHFCCLIKKLSGVFSLILLVFVQFSQDFLGFFQGNHFSQELFIGLFQSLHLIVLVIAVTTHWVVNVNSNINEGKIVLIEVREVSGEIDVRKQRGGHNLVSCHLNQVSPCHLGDSLNNTVFCLVSG